MGIVRWLVLLLVATSGCLSGGGLFGGDNIPESWPSEAAADIHPGMRVFFFQEDGQGSQCTAGFMFASPDNETLYLATTAHCLHEGVDLGKGAVAYLDNKGTRFGKVAYDGWGDGDETAAKDLALVAIDNKKGLRDHAHPNIPAIGGPTGMADAADLPPGTAVEAYGHSVQRTDAAVLRGTLLGTLPAMPLQGPLPDEATYADMDPDPIKGDSGGPLLAGGQAIGLIHAGFEPVGGVHASIFTPLAPAIEAARDAGLAVELVTAV